MTYYISLLEPHYDRRTASTINVGTVTADSPSEALKLTGIKRSKGQVLWARDSLQGRIARMAFIPNVSDLDEFWYSLGPVDTVEFP